MPRVVGVDIPDRKPIRYALRYIHGIGPRAADDVLTETGIDPRIRAAELTDQQLHALASAIDANFVVEGSLRRQTAQAIGRLRDIKCYRGDRHRRNLPCRGQRTRCNARTRKGRKRTVAGKKGVKG